MTHTDLHLAIRRLIAGRPYTFLVSVNSIEQHPGRVELEWIATVFIAGKPNIYVRERSPEVVLERVSDLLAERGEQRFLPPEFAGIGAPPRGTE